MSRLATTFVLGYHDLVTREDVEIVKAAHASFMKFQKEADLPIPENKSAPGQPNSDRVLRYLDCAVLRHLHRMIEEQAEVGGPVEPYDTVRGMFVEGGKLYPGSGIYRRSHVQIAVRNNSCIKGLFIPRPDPSAA